MIEYPNYLNKIFDKLQMNGAYAVIVGGYIRDYLLFLESKQKDRKKDFIPSKDIDIEVYDISSFEELENILQEFGDVNSVGKSFGVCKLNIEDFVIDFSLPRVDNKVSEGHKGFEVDVRPSLDFKTAASRRDFTMNAIGYDVLNKKILDPFGGMDDLKKRVLKAVDPKTFVEDPLRVLRAVQFCARFNLNVDKELLNLCKKMLDEERLNELAKERVFEEIKKLLLKADRPSVGVKLLKETGGFKFFNELSSLKESEYNNLLLSLDELANNRTKDKKSDLVLMLSAICYYLDEKAAQSFIMKLTSQKPLLQKVISLASEKISSSYTDAKLYRLATRVTIREFVILNRAIYKNLDVNIFKVCENIYERAKELNILDSKAEPLLMGRDILAYGIEPSQEFSKILSLAYEAQMNGEFNSLADAHIWLQEYLVSKNLGS